jgi:peroxiredoxin/Tfp pilus assembly protein PilF
MRGPIKKVVLPIVFFLSYWMMPSAPAAATLLALQVGMEGPEFSLKNLTGEPKAFSELKGEKLTILVFWSTWSDKSAKILARMQKLFEKYKEQGLAIIGINADEQRISNKTLSDIRTLQDKLKIGYPMLVDHGLTVFHDYGVIAIPTTIIMDRERLIKYELSGYPLIGAETMVDYVVSTMAGEKPVLAAGKALYQPNKNALRLYNMGKTTLKSKRMEDQAEMWFKKAGEADPDFVLPHLSLGMMYVQKGNALMAQAEFKEVLLREPSNPIALCESGMILVNEGKVSEGAVLFETARKTEESYVPCYYYAGYAYGKEGKLEEAWKMFDEAEKVNPTDYKIFVYKGRVFEERKDLKNAADTYRRALEKILASDLNNF